MAQPQSPEPTSGPLPTGIDLAAVLATDATDRASFRVKIDKYELKESIGGGGMGVVFEAIHDDLGHSVALKLMKHRASSPEALERFIREARVLASCHHSGIAQVYDAGIHRQGGQEIPYYVMEFVRGARTITRYADEKHLSIDQRLELFARVCDAMQSVHDLGIIHRDIKPENILVDSVGQPKVIDFGVARVLNADLPLPASHTAADSLLGTLPYMSPEQTGSEAGHIDKRSDVYSLGVVLYELLCGRLPYSVKDKTIAQAIDIIRQAPPAKPRAVNPELDEDVETILLKALHKDRDRRYGSPGDLAASIRHRLRGEPIPDRRDSATYVLRKRASALVAAHRVSMWLMVTVASLLIATAIGSALAKFTPMNLWFERTVTTWIQPAGFAPFKHVPMVALQEDTDLVELGRSVGVTVDPADRTTFRPVHGILMAKLAQGAPRVVVYDIGFSPGRDEKCPFEEELLEGIRALKRGGCEVVMACGGKWDIGEDDLPPSLCKGIAAETLWGFTRATLDQHAPWSLHLICSPRDRPPMPSLALAACAAYWRSGRYHWVSIEYESRRTLERFAQISYVRPTATQPRQWGAPVEGEPRKVRLSSTIQMPHDDPNHALKRGDWLGNYILRVPDNGSITLATTDVEKVLSASPSDLRRWFEGKVVVVGNARADGKDGPFKTPDGRSLPGFVAHALGIDAILSENTILAPGRTTLLGVNIGLHHLFAAGATVGGALIGAIGAKPVLRRRLLTAGLFVAIVIASVLLYRQSNVLLDPLVALIGTVLAAECIGSMARTRLGG